MAPWLPHVLTDLGTYHDQRITHRRGCCCLQVAPARHCLHAFITNPKLVTIHRAFMYHHLTGRVAPGDAAEAQLHYLTALASLVLAMPGAGYQQHDRLNRPIMWHSDAFRASQSGDDVLAAPLQTFSGNKTVHQDTVSAAASETGTVTRAQAVELFDRCVKPSGMIFAVLQSQRPEGQRRAALELLTTAYQFVSSPATQDADNNVFCCKFHTVALTDAYTSNDVELSCQHLAALQALAQHKVKHGTLLT